METQVLGITSGISTVRFYGSVCAILVHQCEEYNYWV